MITGNLKFILIFQLDFTYDTKKTFLQHEKVLVNLKLLNQLLTTSTLFANKTFFEKKKAYSIHFMFICMALQQCKQPTSSSRIPYSSCKSVVSVVGTLNFIAFGSFPFLAFLFAFYHEQKVITHTFFHILAPLASFFPQFHFGQKKFYF
jgi:hypothetical protein